MKKILLIAVLSLSACASIDNAPPPITDLPVAGPVCTQLQSDKFDLALQAYGAATDAVNLLIDTKVLVPGTPRALAVANANDKVLLAFSTAEHARQACNSGSYLTALNEAKAAIAEIRAALR